MGEVIFGLIAILVVSILLRIKSDKKNKSKVVVKETTGFEFEPLEETPTLAHKSLNVVKGKIRTDEVGRFEVYRDKAEEFRFRLLDVNNNILLSSEGYKRKSNCLNGVKSVKENAVDSGMFSFKTSTNGKEYFNLRARNGRVIGTSKFYNTTDLAKDAMDLVIVQAINDAEVVDKTKVGELL